MWPLLSSKYAMSRACHRSGRPPIIGGRSSPTPWSLSMFRPVLAAAALLLAALPSLAADDWAASVKFPASEKPVPLFNGKDFEGWEGNTGEGGTQKYFSIKDGVIVARNEVENAPKVSNYL